MLFTRILLGLELDHLLAHLAVLEQQHLAARLYAGLLRQQQLQRVE